MHAQAIAGALPRLETVLQRRPVGGLHADAAASAPRAMARHLRIAARGVPPAPLRALVERG